MTPREKGFLLLSSHLGDPNRKILTVAQLRLLAKSVAVSDLGDREGAVTAESLMELGYNRPSAQRVVELLSQETQLDWYLHKGMRRGCVPITRVTDGYPLRLRQCLGLDAPGVLWTKGDVGLLNCPGIALVGSRDLYAANLAFAEEVGRQAAIQGLVLISGNARGADRAAQDSCLKYGGKVISIVADALESYTPQDGLLYISEDGFDIPFSAQRALQRNRIIHTLGRKTFVAQCRLGKGGTWEGTKENLRRGWSDVFCLDDNSPAAQELICMGAVPIAKEQLKNIDRLQSQSINFIDQ